MSDLYSAAGDISSMALAADGTGIAQASDIIKQDGKLYVLASDGDCSIFYWLDGEQVKVSDPASGTAWGNARPEKGSCVSGVLTMRGNRNMYVGR